MRLREHDDANEGEHRGDDTREAADGPVLPEVVYRVAYGGTDTPASRDWEQRS